MGDICFAAHTVDTKFHVIAETDPTSDAFLGHRRFRCFRDRVSAKVFNFPPRFR